MKNNKTKKILAALGMGLTLASSGIFITGCNHISSSKLNNYIEKSEDLLDIYKNIDYEKLASDLQNYLNKPEQLTPEQIKTIMVEDIYNLIKLSMTQNYTYKHKNQTIRVEYTSSSLTKIYCYELDDHNNKTKEVYREITNDKIKTYIKELQLYSEIDLLDYNYDNYHNLLTFNSTNNIALKITDNETTTFLSWDQLFDACQENPDTNEYTLNYYYNNAHSLIYNTKTLIEELTTNELINTNTKLSIDNETHIYTTNLYYNEPFYFNYDEIRYEITSHSYKSIVTGFYNHEGIPSLNYQDGQRTNYEELIFDTDNQNIINFDTTGYTSASSYYESHNNQSS